MISNRGDFILEPVIKFPGGKTKLISELSELINKEALEGHTYFEPFIGGGAFAFYLGHEKTVINDFNFELISLYKAIRDFPDGVITYLKSFAAAHSEKFYYELRDLDRDEDFQNLFSTASPYLAARTIYLNKTCFNGLYRVNSKGFFNVPLGRTSSGKLPDIVQEDKIRELSEFLKKITILHGDFEAAVKDAKQGDFIFFDPPYDTAETIKSKGFVSYQKTGWNHNDLVRLKNLCDDLVDRGCKVVITNNDTEFVRETFKDYNLKSIDVAHQINRDGKNRKAKELIISAGF